MTSQDLSVSPVEFIFHVAAKLNLSSTTLASACTYYYRVFSHIAANDLDNYCVAAVCTHIASKSEEDHVRFRDLVNCCFAALHTNKPILSDLTTYSQLRESLSQMELVVLRLLQFRLQVTHPHKYLDNFLHFLFDWLPEPRWRCQVSRLAWALLRDTYLKDICIRHKPEYIAAAVVVMALQASNLPLPPCDAKDVSEVFLGKRPAELDVIIDEVLIIYETEGPLIRPLVAEPTGQC